MITGNESAHPEIVTDRHPSGFEDTYSYGGLSILQYFSVKLMCAYRAQAGVEGYASGYLAKKAIADAKALIDELNKQTTS